MSTTRFAAVLRPAALAGLLLASRGLSATPVLVPVALRVHGQNEALWSVEARITNRTDAARTFRVADFIGTPGWKPATFTVPPRATISLGGADIFNGPYTSSAVFGLAVLDADPELLVQSAVLTGIWRPGGVSYVCPSFDGGTYPAGCQGIVGAGPLVDGLAFSPAGKALFIPWLHTDEGRRTNLVLVNPDEVAAHVSVVVVSQDGLTTRTEDYVFEPRSYNQLGDLFAQAPFAEIRAANERSPFGAAAATSTITGDTRLVAMAYVIGNEDNSLTISLPR